MKSSATRRTHQNGDRAPSTAVSVRDYGAVGDGQTDDTAAIQSAFSSNATKVTIHPGVYRVTSALFVPSGKTIIASQEAHIILDGDECPCLLTNARKGYVDEDISICGGIWDAADSGSPAMDFTRVRGLRLDDITTANATGSHIRLSSVDGFDIRRVHFNRKEAKACDDGLHLAGCCRNGRVADMTTSDGAICGSLVALSADSSSETPHIPCPICGPIENISFRDLDAGCCQSAIRLRSTRSTIRNIRFENVANGATRLAIGDHVGDWRKLMPADIGHLDNIVFDDLSINSEQVKPKRSGERIRTHILLEDGEFLITSPFGERTHPVTGEVASFHSGVDGALWDGRMLVETGICAWDDAVVAAAEEGDALAGTHVTLDHGHGLVTKYLHMEDGSLRVKAGDHVRKGDLLGRMGRTGRSTGEHLHFQVEKDGTPVDPMPYLRRDSR